MRTTDFVTLRYSVVTSTVPTYASKKRVMELVAKSAKRWNEAMLNWVYLTPAKRVADIVIKFGTVNRSSSKDRVAQCTRTRSEGGLVNWEIILADDVKWDTSSWWQFWKGGDENFLCAIMHELGHVWLNPPYDSQWHSDISGDVMASSLLNSIITNEEAARYRARYKFLTNI
jgi:hypothetical protein